MLNPDIQKMTADSTAPDCGLRFPNMDNTQQITRLYSPYGEMDESRKRKTTIAEEDSDTDDDDAKSYKTDTDGKSSINGRPSNHSAIEKKRRDLINHYITQVSALVPMCAAMPRKLDKLTVLRLAVQHMKTLRGSVQSCGDDSYKPNCLSDDELKILIEEVAEGFVMVVCCDKGKILYCSDSIEQALGWNPQELSGKSCFDIVQKEDVSILKEQMTNTPTNDQATNMDHSESVSSSTSLTAGLNCFCSGAKRRFYCRMKRVNVERVSESTHQRCPKRKYVSVRCTGYLKTWPPALSNNVSNSQSDLPTTSSDPDSIPNFTCLVLSVLPLSLESADISTDFALKLGIDGRMLYVDYQVSDALGFLPQELLNRSYYDFIHESDLIAVAEIHKRALETEEGLWVGGTEPYKIKHKSAKFVPVAVRWRCFRNPWTKEQEFVTVEHKTLIQNAHETSSNQQSEEQKRGRSTLMQLLSKLPNEPTTASTSPTSTRVGAGKIGNWISDASGSSTHKGVTITSSAIKHELRPVVSTPLTYTSVDKQLRQNLVPDCRPGAQRNHDEATMSVLMNLLDAEGGLGGAVDFGEIPWPL